VTWKFGTDYAGSNLSSQTNIGFFNKLHMDRVYSLRPVGKHIQILSFSIARYAHGIARVEPSPQSYLAHGFVHPCFGMVGALPVHL